MAVKCDQLIYTPVNALTFRITGATKCLIPQKSEYEITSLKGGSNDVEFTLGLTTKIKGIKYKVNLIQKSIDSTYYDLSIAKRTKASTFIMPMLSGNRRLFFWNRLFMNCFIAIPDNDTCIALLYRWSSDPLFIKFEKALSTFKYFRKRYDPSPDYVMFVFDIPKKHTKNFDNFLEGKYSQLSKTYKIDILDFHDLEANGEVGQILFKSPKRKKLLETKLDVILEEDSELLSIINKDRDETFNFETYKFNKLL
tara:strand:+ start:499 stop:1257 length:759 start_codon:yes stop_codon:yes gene_type:complete